MSHVSPHSSDSAPLATEKCADVVMNHHGTGGTRGRRFVGDLFREAFSLDGAALLTPIVDGTTHDSALVDLQSSRVAVTTDAYVVSPLFFPGGNIGELAVCGSINNLATIGALTRAITATFVLEEGLPLDDLRRIVESMATAARRANVRLVAGDTKVVERGKGDGVYVSITALGTLPTSIPWHPGCIHAGDVILVSGDIGRHGAAVLSARAGKEFKDAQGHPLMSDVTSLWPCVSELLGFMGGIACLRDLTRGGLGNALIELSEQAGLAFEVEQAKVPVNEAVVEACAAFELDPMYVACEGRLVVFARPESAATVLERLQRFHAEAAIVGRVLGDTTPRVDVVAASGSRRKLDGEGADRLPRVC